MSLMRLPAMIFFASLVIVPTASYGIEQYPVINVMTDIQYRTRIGHLRAGKVCLPNAALYFEDLYVSKSRLNELVYLAVQNLPAGKFKSRVKATGLNLRLVDVDAKLCAKSWGLFGSGARDQLSGTVRLVFQWSHGSAPLVDQQSLEVAIPSDEARPKDAIARLTMDRLIADLAGQAEK